MKTQNTISATPSNEAIPSGASHAKHLAVGGLNIGFGAIACLGQIALISSAYGLALASSIMKVWEKNQFIAVVSADLLTPKVKPKSIK